MGNTNHRSLLPLQRFARNEEQKLLLVNGYCRSILCQLYDYKQFNLNVITRIVTTHYDYTINSSIQLLSKLICKTGRYSKNNYYLAISFEISQMLIESHHSIHQQFMNSTKKNGLKSKNDFPDYYYEEKLDEYLNGGKKLQNVNISRMDFIGKLRSINKLQPICPCKTIANYSFIIRRDPTAIYNGIYRRCLSLQDTEVSDNGEVAIIKPKKYNTLAFDKKRLNIWVHQDDVIDNVNGNGIETKVPNKRLKYIRCLSRNEYNDMHCYWRLHCLKLNNNGKLLHLQDIGEHHMDENSKEYIQYLGIVHQWMQRNGGYSSSKEILPQYYEYPCGRHTLWRKVEGESFVSEYMSLFHNQFSMTLPRLNNLGSTSNTIRCKLLECDSKIFWNNKFIKCIEKNINYTDNKNEAKLIYYFIMIWLNQLIYKVALDHGVNFKKINKHSVAPHFYYKKHWNPLPIYLQKNILNEKIKYYGKDVYFKNIETNCIKIADENYIIQTVDELLKCLQLKLKNKNRNNNKQWMKRLNEIQLTPIYKSKLIKK